MTSGLRSLISVFRLLISDLRPLISDLRSLISVFRSLTSVLALGSLLFPLPALAYELQLTPSIALREEYNDNVFFDTQNAESDFITRITPGLELTDKTERLDARLLAQVPIYKYVDNDELDDVDQLYSGNLHYLLTERLSASLRGGYFRTSQPDREILETGLVLGNVIRQRYFGGFSGEYALSDISSLGVAYDYIDDNYNSPNYTDMQSNIANFVYAHDVSRIVANTRGRVTFGYGRYDFSDSSVDNYAGTVGFIKKLTEVYSLSADVGVRYTVSNFLVGTQEQTSGVWGPVARAALSYTGEYTTASFTLFDDISTSGGNEGTVQRTSFVFDVGRHFIYELWGHLTAGYFLNTSDNNQYALQNIDEQSWSVSPWLRYNFSRNLSLDGSYLFTRVNYKTNDTHANRNVIFLRLEYRYPLLQ
jgi:hypothetical protein